MEKILILLSSLAVTGSVHQRNGNIYFNSNEIHAIEGRAVTNPLFVIPTSQITSVITTYGQGEKAVKKLRPLLTMITQSAVRS